MVLFNYYELLNKWDLLVFRAAVLLASTVPFRPLKYSDWLKIRNCFILKVTKCWNAMSNRKARELDLTEYNYSYLLTLTYWIVVFCFLSSLSSIQDSLDILFWIIFCSWLYFLKSSKRLSRKWSLSFFASKSCSKL